MSWPTAVLCVVLVTTGWCVVTNHLRRSFRMLAIRVGIPYFLAPIRVDEDDSDNENQPAELVKLVWFTRAGRVPHTDSSCHHVRNVYGAMKSDLMKFSVCSNCQRIRARLNRG